MANAKQADRMRGGAGFVAALDQSGGSTPKALQLYGIESAAYTSEAEMFDLIHQMRTRIVRSPSFTSERVIAAILFENTMDREIDGQPFADFLWGRRGVVPFLKVDQGLADEGDGVQVMKPMDGLDDLLERAAARNIFGTKARSVINAANPNGISAIVDQQFEIGKRIQGYGLVPIIEPEVTISISDRERAEEILLAELGRRIDLLGDRESVILKLSLPIQANHYRSLVEHPRVMRVVALSGGYSRVEANAKLAQNDGVVASFSRALTEGLTVDQSDSEFDTMLADTIDSIYRASVSG